jgi:hypothetical protein
MTLPMLPLAVHIDSYVYYLFGGAALISVLAFAALILAPALSAYGRTWEKATAAMLSLFVFVALLALGIGIGLAVFYFWDDIYGLFN